MTGRKPIPAALIDAAEHKRSAEEIQERRDVEKRLQTTAVLKCPKGMSEEGKREWRRVMKPYRAMEVDILCDLDLQLLVMYCEGTAIYKKAQETWVKYNSVVSSHPEAQRILDKCLAVMERQQRLVSSLAEQLCLSPVGRARMGMNAASKKKGPSELEQLFEDD